MTDPFASPSKALSLFNQKRTTGQLKHVYQSGLAQSEPVWNFGYPILTRSFPTLINGLWYILAPENVGKSMLQLNVAYQVLVNNPDAYWLDFSLDDSVEDRLGYLIARAGNLPIDLVLQAGAAEEELKTKRKAAFETFTKNYGGRYHLFGATNNNETDEEFHFTAEWIASMVREAREQIGPGHKLLVTIDSFHDVDLQARSEDENDRLGQKSKLFKRTATNSNALFLMTAHTRKDSRKRGQTADATWGTARLSYDAKIMTLLFSDVNLNREKATVFWISQDKPNTLMPVHELDIVKNKVGGAKTTIFFNYYPYNCQDFEVDEVTQTYYKSCIYSKGSSKDK